MGRGEIGLVSSTLPLPAAAFLAVTGLVSDALDLNEFVFHKYTGYAATVLVLVHVYAHWPPRGGLWRGAARGAAGWRTPRSALGRLPGEDVGALYPRASEPGFADALGAIVGWGVQ